MAAFISAFTFILAQAEEGGTEGGIQQYMLYFYIVAFIAIFYFLLIRPGQKQRKVHQELVGSIKKGDEIMTAGGIYGTVTKIADDYIMMEIAKKVEIKVSRNSVARRETVQAELEEEAGEPPEAPAEPEA